MLTDPYGTTLEGDYDYIVFSSKIYPVAQKINELRKADGRPMINIVRIEYVMADDDIPISSTRIVHGGIDVHVPLKGSRC